MVSQKVNSINYIVTVKCKYIFGHQAYLRLTFGAFHEKHQNQALVVKEGSEVRQCLSCKYKTDKNQIMCITNQSMN